MFKKFILSLLIICTLISIKDVQATYNDSTNIDELVAFDWTPISDVDKIIKFVKDRDLTKRTKDQTEKGNVHYNDAIALMNNKEYLNAITEFKAAQKRYKRAKLSDDALNLIRVNMALCYAKTGNKEDVAVSERLLNLITSKIYSDKNWSYNIAIAYFLIGQQSEAADILSNIIRKYPYEFQSYITLEAIFRNSGNDTDADKVLERMETAEERLNKKKQRSSSKSTKNKEKKEDKKDFLPKGKKPDVTNLRIVKNDDLLQFNQINKIDERSMIQIQEGISEYNLGVKALSDKEYQKAQQHLKNTEKKLKRGKVSPDGLSYARGNLAISYLALGQKRGASQAKRYLRNLTSKLYKTRDWIYNMAVAYYTYTDITIRRDRAGNRKESLTTIEYTKKAIKLLQQTIRQDKLYLPAYENLIYIYQEQKQENKASKTYKDYLKARSKLMQSFSREDQIAQGNNPYIFRINLGIFGEFDTPAMLSEKENVIAIPIDEQRTAYLAGKFYNLDEAESYQKKLKSEGYNKAFIVAYQDGDKLEDF